MSADYSDIINLPRHVSLTHKHMSNSDRAAQFAPFAALTGYEQIIKEVARITAPENTLSYDQKEKINKALSYLRNNSDNKVIYVKYFVKDNKKSGGKYLTIKGALTKLNLVKKVVIIEEKYIIPIKDIYDIDIEGYFDL